MDYKLDKLPVELLACILSYLPLHDHCSIRRVNHALESRATQKSFKDIFRTKTLYVAKKSLEDFIAVTQPGRLGTLLNTLILVGVSINYTELGNTVRKGTRSRNHFSGGISMICEDSLTAQELQSAEKNLNVLSKLQSSNLRLFGSKEAETLLAKAFMNLKNNGNSEALHHLGLDVMGLRDDPTNRMTPGYYRDFAAIWSTAGKLFYSSMTALAQSGLSVSTLDIYNTTQYCSLSLPQLDRFKSAQLRQVTADLKSLEISLSRSFPLTGAHTTKGTTLVPIDSFIALNELISCCANLEVLRIHYFTLGARCRMPPYNEVKESHLTVFPANHHWNIHPPLTLREVSLAGVGVTQAGLLAFLQYHSVKALRLNEVTLQACSFRPIFEWIDNQSSPMDLDLEDVYESKLVLFPHEVVRSDGTVAIATSPRLRRTGDASRQPIKYVLSNSSVETGRQLLMRRARFGPLGS